MWNASSSTRWPIEREVRRSWRAASASSWRVPPGHANREVARRTRVTPATEGKWRARFQRDSVAGLSDELRPGTPRTITDAQVEQVVVQTLETTPRGATHWSTRSLAKATGLSRIDHQSHLAGLRVAAASERDVQALPRPVPD